MRIPFKALHILPAILLFGISGCAGRTLLKETFVPAELKGGRSLSVQLFNVTSIPRYDDEPIDNLRIYLAEELAASLRELKVFGDIHVLKDNEAPYTDLVFEGEFIGIDEGERQGAESLMDALGGVKYRRENIASLAVKGRIKTRDSRIVYAPRDVLQGGGVRCLLCPSIETEMRDIIDRVVKGFTDDLRAELNN